MQRALPELRAMQRALHCMTSFSRPRPLQNQFHARRTVLELVYRYQGVGGVGDPYKVCASAFLTRSSLTLLTFELNTLPL